MRFRSKTQYLIVFVRSFVGGHFALSGINYFFEFVEQPKPKLPIAAQYVDVMIEMGLYQTVKVAEALVGLMLLTNVFVPLALVMAFPLTLAVFYNNVVVAGTPRQLYTGTRGVVLDLFLLAAYARYYLPLTTFKATVTPVWSMVRKGELKLKDGALVEETGR